MSPGSIDDPHLWKLAQFPSLVWVERHRSRDHFGPSRKSFSWWAGEGWRHPCFPFLPCFASSGALEEGTLPVTPWTRGLGSHSHEIGLSFRHLLRVKTGPTNQGRQSHTWLWHVSWLQWPFHKTISEFVILLGPLQLCQLIFAATSVNIDWALQGNGKRFTFHVTQWQPQATQGTWINSFNPLI